MKRIAFIVQLPKNVSPGQRFRLEQYENFLQAKGFHIDTFPFLDNKSYKILYENGFFLRKVKGVTKGFFGRFFLLFRLKGYDYVFLQREFAPIGPPFFEWITSHLLRVKIIYDFDDAIWIPNVSANNKLALSLKAFWKVKYICKWSYKVSVGNYFLGKWAAKYNSNIVYNPTCVDTENRYNLLKEQGNEIAAIGWTGSHSTLKYLDKLKPVLERLEQEYHFEFLVICDKEPEWNIKSLRFIPWKEENEIKDLLQINIGVMPLENDAWSEGKCGFKLIQYLALGIPAIASPVGVNKEIIVEGVNGFLSNTEQDWYNALKTLLTDQRLRVEMGLAGRKKIKEQYSLQSNEATFHSLFSN